MMNFFYQMMQNNWIFTCKNTFIPHTICKTSSEWNIDINSKLKAMKPPWTKQKRKILSLGLANGFPRETVLSLGEPLEISGDVFGCLTGDETLLVLVGRGQGYYETT